VMSAQRRDSSKFFPGTKMALALALLLAFGRQLGFSQQSGAVKKKHGSGVTTPLVADAAKSDVPPASLNTTPSDKPVHIVVGRSIFINTKDKLTRVYVTNPAVLYAYTASPTQVVVTSKEPGVSSLILWEESGAMQSYLFSSDVDMDALRVAVKQALPGEDIKIEGDENRIVLTGMVSSGDASEAAAKIAGLYSKDIFNALVVNSSHIKQVKLKVRMVEVDRTKMEQFGFNFFSAGGNNLAQTTTSQFPSTLTASTGGASSSASGNSSTAGNKSVSVSNPLNFLIYNSALNIGATLQDLQSKQILQILAEPTISTLSGKEADFLAGGEFPFPVVQGIAGGLTSISVQFKPYGVKLNFTPYVNADGTIQLKVAPEVSALDYTNAVTISGYTIPALSTRRAETEVVLNSGQSFAISGLLDRRITDAFYKTPGFASIPILGELFKSKSLNHSNTELIVIVTPEIVDPMAENATSQEPKLAVPPMNSGRFDEKLPKSETQPPSGK
jgi:pilus assembly protein CpaC